MSPEKIGNLVECKALLAQGNLQIHCETTAYRDVCNSHRLQKKNEGCDKFDSVSTGSPHWEGVRGDVSWFLRHTAHALHRPYRYTSEYSVLYDIWVALGPCCLFIVGTSTTLSRNRTRDLHKLLQLHMRRAQGLRCCWCRCGGGWK